jgi:ribosomal protein L9
MLLTCPTETKVVVVMRRKYMEESDAMHGPVRKEDVAAKLLKQHSIHLELDDLLMDSDITTYGTHAVPVRIQAGEDGDATEALLKVDVQKW